MATMTKHGPPMEVTRPRQAWHFARHFIEMCVAMCVGVGLANVVIGVAGAITGLDLREQLPALSLLVLAVFITLPMVAWMRFRGMAWRPILEMCAAGIVAVIVAAGLGLVSASAVAIGSLCGLECVGMLIAMLFRLDLYTGRTGHQMGHATQTA